MYDSYQSIMNYLAKGKDKTNRPAPEKSKNTRFIKIDDHSCAIQLHGTNIITYYSSGVIELNTNGWRTNTTRERMNRWQNHFRIHQEKFIWFVSFQGGDFLYQDHMLLYPNNGMVCNLNEEMMHTYTEKELEKKTKLKKKIDNFCNKFIEKFFNYEIRKPNSGDCWNCQFFDSKQSNNNNHIMSHINESYYVPSMLVNAINEFENKLAIVDKYNIAHFFKQDGWESNKPFAIDMTKDRLKKVLKQYIKKQLNLGIS